LWNQGIKDVHDPFQCHHIIRTVALGAFDQAQLGPASSR
jgi:hypothetical protein